MKVYLVGTNHPDESIPSIKAFTKESEAQFEFLSTIKYLTEDVRLGKEDALELTNEQKEYLSQSVYYDDTSGVIVFMTESDLTI